MSTPSREDLGLRRRPPESSTPATPGSGSRRVPGGVDETRSRQGDRGRVAPRWSPAAPGQRTRAAWSNDPARHPPRPTARRPAGSWKSGACVGGGRRDTGSYDVIPRQETAMSDTPKLLLQKDGPIGWIIFNQPEKRNAVSLEMWQLMPECVQDLAADDAIRVVVMRGAGDQAFVAGADISQFKERRRNMADQEEYGRISARGQDSLGTLTKPLLAMIHGFCVGGGVGIAVGCDMRIASDDARFGIPAARLGLGYHYKGMEKLMKLVGPAYTKEIFFTARTDFTAQDAH